MIGLLTELAKAGGRIAREHFAAVKDLDISVKGHGDYVSHVDRLVEVEIIRRIHARHPDHQILGEEGSPQWPSVNRSTFRGARVVCVGATVLAGVGER